MPIENDDSQVHETPKNRVLLHGLSGQESSPSVPIEMHVTPKGRYNVSWGITERSIKYQPEVMILTT
jgi:hypothetical protein